MSKQFDYTSIVAEEMARRDIGYEEIARRNIANFLKATNDIPKTLLNNITISTAYGQMNGKNDIDILLSGVTSRLKKEIENNIDQIHEDLILLGLRLVFVRQSQNPVQTNNEKRPFANQRVHNGRARQPKIRGQHTDLRTQHTNEKQTVDRPYRLIFNCVGERKIGPQVKAFVKYPDRTCGLYDNIHDHLSNLPSWVIVCYYNDRTSEQTGQVLFFEYILRDGNPDELRTILKSGISINGCHYEMTVVDDNDWSQFKPIKS